MSIKSDRLPTDFLVSINWEYSHNEPEENQTNSEFVSEYIVSTVEEGKEKILEMFGEYDGIEQGYIEDMQGNTVIILQAGITPPYWQDFRNCEL